MILKSSFKPSSSVVPTSSFVTPYTSSLHTFQPPQVLSHTYNARTKTSYFYDLASVRFTDYLHTSIPPSSQYVRRISRSPQRRTYRPPSLRCLLHTFMPVRVQCISICLPVYNRTSTYLQRDLGAKELHISASMGTRPVSIVP